MKKMIVLCSLLVLSMLFAVTPKALAQPSCDPCPGVSWSSPTISTFTFSLAARPGCLYKGYVKYRTRICGGKVQVEILPRPVFEDLNGGNPSCALHCIDAPKLERAVYDHIFGLLGTGAPIIKVQESPCYYTAEITVPAGAEVCYGMTPGTTRWITIPCDDNGCCYSELTPIAGGGYNQSVISSTPCPAAPPTVPPGTTIEWECDILGGGSASFTVGITPVAPLTCEMTCYDGIAKPGKTTSVGELEEGSLNIYNLNIYPNPVDHELHISFDTRKTMDVTVEMFDVTGKTLIQQKHNAQPGKQTINLNTQTLPSGTYGVRVVHEDGQVTTTVVK